MVTSEQPCRGPRLSEKGRDSATAGGPSSGGPPGAMTRDQLFSTSVEALDISSQLLHSPSISKYKWYSQAHVQWHIVAFVQTYLKSNRKRENTKLVTFNITVK